MSEMAQPLLSSQSEDDDEDEEDEEEEAESSILSKTGEETIPMATKGVFIYRLYFILAIQLLVGIAMNVALTARQEVMDFLKESVICLILSLSILLLNILLLIYAKSFVRRPPFNYIELVLFTFNEAFCIGYLCVITNPYAFLIGLIMALTVTLSLLMYSMYAKDAFTSSLGLPTAIFSTVFVFAVCMRISYDTSPFDVVLPTQILCTLFLVLYSIYIVIDVQLLVSSGRYGLTYDDHVIGSLYLYIDVVSLFWSCVELGKNSFD